MTTNSERSETVTAESMGSSKKITQIPTAKTPRIRVIGCGGCGIRIVSKIASALAKNLSVRMAILDASTADLAYASNIQVITIGGGGSGMFRRENVNEIASQIKTRVFSELALEEDEIVLAIFSASGGSGSVIAPLLIQELGKRNVLSVAVTVVDTSTALYVENSGKTLESLEVIAKAANVYLPTMTFTNDLYGQRLATEEIVKQIQVFADIVTLPIISIDQADRRHWLNPHKTLNLPAGIHTLCVAKSDGEVPKTQFLDKAPALYDSVVTFIPEGKELEDLPDEYKVQALSGKVGYIPAGNQSRIYTGRIHVPGEDYREFVARLRDQRMDATAYVQRVTDSVVTDDKTRIDPTGLVL